MDSFSSRSFSQRSFSGTPKRERSELEPRPRPAPDRPQARHQPGIPDRRRPGLPGGSPPWSPNAIPPSPSPPGTATHFTFSSPPRNATRQRSTSPPDAQHYQSTTTTNTPAAAAAAAAAAAPDARPRPSPLQFNPPGPRDPHQGYHGPLHGPLHHAGLRVPYNNRTNSDNLLLASPPPTIAPRPRGTAPSPTPPRSPPLPAPTGRVTRFQRYWKPHYNMFFLLLRVWMTVRRKVLTVAAVDGLFAATEDLTALFNFELFKEAKLAMVLVIYVWLTPLIVIFASETLAVQPQTMTEETTCPSVRSLNFGQEDNNDWRVANYIDGLPEASVSYWNITSKSEDATDPDVFDYWSGPSQPLEQIATLAAFLGGPVAREDAATQACGVGWNCTFTVHFVAPGYKCTELANGVGSEVKKLDGGEYPDQLMDSGDAGIPFSPPPFPKNLGAFRTEPVIWVGYASVEDPTQKQPESQSDPAWATAFTPKIFACEHYETEYEVEFHYVSLQQETKIKSRKYLNRIVDTVFQRGDPADDGTYDNTTAVPEDNYVRPSDGMARYRRIAAYHALGTQLRRFVNGTIHEPAKILKTKASQTRLIDIHSYLPAGDLMADIASFYEDIILSLLSKPQFLSVVWAASPQESSGHRKADKSPQYPCVRHRTSNHYVYHVADLWAVYTIAIFLALVATAFGMMAIWEEGTSRDTRFSSVAAATRGSALEKIPFGPEGEMRTRARRIKIGYGVLDRGNYGFGVEGEVLQGAGIRRSAQTFRLV
ncbi:unnamed protein product [Parascedosporium putredinis]|uniref:Uncharacterized protein n=1 Tax=Parascedosporium putredinis TaxID=1442378 RepID=A0A9P1HCP1_9PEZI|nr:unnamed protein product [Parascedosporium putredinis]CAI8004926.1 unnamed protein product [Parascedosporium putredinis]